MDISAPLAWIKVTHHELMRSVAGHTCVCENYARVGRRGYNSAGGIHDESTVNISIRKTGNKGRLSSHKARGTAGFQFSNSTIFLSMWLYDIFDPEGYNNLFVLTLISEPIVLAGCHVPTSPENRTFKITAFYRWLELISKVYTKSKSKWSLYPCDIKPGTLPFAINIESLTREPVDRDSTDNISPGAYLILTDGARSAPEVLKDTLDSKELNLFSVRKIPIIPLRL
ncbi:hypothetical protein BS47DRAFT_721748 [Hydnum rufescens UP504]|uniref:Uncharacterized protein n=1 Tax=Hydnum rufescens UP504 TaxID=1448309 RepID=A0A9P6DZC2_9AGAM|nr:hypothetical protein BS47DRAFT_721748 [Hydnum rufescens UP504]